MEKQNAEFIKKKRNKNKKSRLFLSGQLSEKSIYGLIFLVMNLLLIVFLLRFLQSSRIPERNHT